jgi:hypothetical protein
MFQEEDANYLITRMNKLEAELIELQNVLKKKISPNVVRYLSVQLPYDQVKVSDAADFERPFDNVRAVFDKETGNLVYIGLVDDLPF